MKIGVIPEAAPEADALQAGAIPTPLIETWYGFMLARAIMVATKCGVFEALAGATLTAAEVAARCNLSARGTEKLLHAMLGAEYVTCADGRYGLAATTRKWLLRDAPGSFHDKMLFQFLEWEWWSGCEQFVRTGEPIAIHDTMTEGDWALYQRGMRAGKDAAAEEVAARLPVPAGARTLLDIGGSHGMYAVALCRAHPELRAAILDLPDAIAHAAPLLAREHMGDRVVHRPGNALTADLGEDSCDVVFIGSLVHHFDDATNRALVARVRRALRPGGVLAILEVLRLKDATQVNQLGGLLDLYFSMTSQSGTWSAEEIADWQRAAGLVPLAPIRLRSAPNVALQLATRPS